jgi:epoxyqueuosine reductase
MNYLSRPDTLEKRAHPDLLLPGAKSLVSLALPYPPAQLALAPHNLESSGRIASYAWGTDYHLIIPGLLEQLVERLSFSSRGIRYKTFVDSAPILERGFAAQSGLGWIGKNSCLIHPELGSYFFLAEILTDYEFDLIPQPMTDHCGTCRRCIDACPTDCILPDRTINSSRCISYLTIENKVEIPQDLQHLIGNWVFGCDVCQMVCPWNQHLKLSQMQPELNPTPTRAWINLIDELNRTEQEFEMEYGTRPIARSKSRGWLRNCIVACGNLQSSTLLPILVSILHNHPDFMLRSQAAQSIAQFPPSISQPILDLALHQESNLFVRQRIVALLPPTSR